MMLAQLVLKNGRVIPLTDDAYERVMQIVAPGEQLFNAEPTSDLETLMADFQDLYGTRMPSAAELLDERKLERIRERHRLELVP